MFNRIRYERKKMTKSVVLMLGVLSRNRMGIGKTELGDYAVNESCLREGNSACSTVTFNHDADMKVSRPTVGDLPMSLQLGLELGQRRLGVT